MYKWWILFEMGILLFVLMFCLTVCPMDFFSSVFIVLEVFFPFFLSYSPLLVKKKKKNSFLGGKISVPCVSCAVSFVLGGCAFGKSSKNLY